MTEGIGAGRPSRPKRAQVRADIVSAATSAFESAGYADTSVDAVAAAAGYTKGAVYSNFGSKPELFAEACAERLAAISADLLERVAPVLDAGGERDELVRPLAEAVVAATLDTPLRWQLLLNEFRGVALRDPAVDAAYQKLSARRVAVLVELLSSNAYLARLAPAALQRSVLVLLTLVNALALEHAAAPETVDASTVTHIVAAFFDVVLP